MSCGIYMDIDMDMDMDVDMDMDIMALREKNRSHHSETSFNSGEG